MIFNKKSQASFELIVNYAWVIMIIILAIGLINYLGFFNIDSILPNNYISSGNLILLESLIVPEMTDSNTNQIVSSVYLNLINSYNLDLNITKLSLIKINDYDVNVLCFEDSLVIPRDLSKILYCHINNDSLESIFNDNSISLIFNMTFNGVDDYVRFSHNTFLYVRTKNFVDQSTFCTLKNSDSLFIHDLDGIKNCGES